MTTQRDKLVKQITELGIVDDVSYQWDKDDGTHYRFSMNPDDIPKIIDLCMDKAVEKTLNLPATKHDRRVFIQLLKGMKND